MHTLKSIYCRTFQTALKIALPFLPYRTPKIVGSVKKLPEIIQQEGCSSVLLITDAQITKLGLTKRLEQSFCNAGISYTIYDKTVANPTTTNVAEALELYHLRGCDCIIGFGGGSNHCRNRKRNHTCRRNHRCPNSLQICDQRFSAHSEICCLRS